MNEKEALELNIEVWRYLADHPEIRNKRDLPDELYAEIVAFPNKCPLCEYYGDVHFGSVLSCGECVLYYGGQCCNAEGREFKRWTGVFIIPASRRTRRRAALAIVRRCRKRLDELEE